MPSGILRLRSSKNNREMPEMNDDHMAHNLHCLSHLRIIAIVYRLVIIRAGVLDDLLDGHDVVSAGVIGFIRVGRHETIDCILKDTQAADPASGTSALGLPPYGVSLWRLGGCFWTNGR